MLTDFGWIHIYLGFAILIIALIVLWARGRSFSHLFFDAVFGVYLIGVVSVVVFPIHIPEKGTELNRVLQLNLIPFNFGRCDFLSLCIRNIYQNILLTIPFGFGIRFITPVKSKRIFWLALAVGLTFEIIQILISLVVQSAFRVVDINDVILNAVGVLIGYGVFRILGRLYLLVTDGFEIRHRYIFSYLYDVVTQS